MQPNEKDVIALMNIVNLVDFKRNLSSKSFNYNFFSHPRNTDSKRNPGLDHCLRARF